MPPPTQTQKVQFSYKVVSYKKRVDIGGILKFNDKMQSFRPEIAPEPRLCFEFS